MPRDCIPNLPVVLVDWVDSQRTGGWTHLEELKEKAGEAHRLECRTVGFLLAETDEMLLIVPSLGSGQGADGMSIPRCAIRSVRQMKTGKGK